MKRDINFFSTYQGKKQDIKEKQNNLVMYIVMALVAVFIVGTFTYHKVCIYIAERKIEEIEEKMADPKFKKQLAISDDLDVKIASVKAYNSGVESITKDVNSRKVVTPELLDDVLSTKPAEVLFKQYDISNTTIDIQAQSTSRDAIAVMQHNLRKLERVQNVEIDTISEEGTSSFHIKVTIKDVE